MAHHCPFTLAFRDSSALNRWPYQPRPWLQERALAGLASPLQATAANSDPLEARSGWLPVIGLFPQLGHKTLILIL